MKYTGERFIPDNDGLEIEAEHVHRYRAIASCLKNMKVLDAGCGTGYGSLLLSQFAKEVVGVDISLESIEWCKDHYSAQENLTFIQSSLESLPFNDAEFDCIVILEVIEHVDENIQKKFLKEAKRILKSNGTLVISTPNKAIYTDKSGYRNPYHISEFYLDDFKTYLKQEFKNVKLYNQSLYAVSSITDESLQERRARIIQNSNIDVDGKYMIAICSNESGAISPFDLTSVYKYDAQMSVNMSSLYSSENGDFYSQDHKQSKTLVTEENNTFSVTFDISHDSKSDRFRFDPIENCFCVCNIDEVITDGEVASITPLNALKYYKKGFLFMNVDPQFEINGDFKQATYLTLKGYFKIMTQVEISEIVDDIYKRMMEAIDKSNNPS